MAVEAVTVSVDQPYSESWDIRSVAGLGDPESGYPLVQLIDHEGYEVSQVQARVDSTGYVYKADLYIPPVDLLDTVVWTVVWTVVDLDGRTHTQHNNIYVAVNATEDFDDVLICADDQEFTFTAPVRITGDIELRAYHGNTLLWSVNNWTFPNKLIVTPRATATIFNLKLQAPTPGLQDYAVHVLFTQNGRPARQLFTVWSFTPSMMAAATELERRMNKARLHHEQHSMNWTNHDLACALRDGLDSLNSTGSVTTFDGTEMRGGVRLAWMACAERAALEIQLKGENDQAFSFGGQSVNYETMRTQAIETRLGQLDTWIGAEVKPLKDKLIVYGITGGSGANGDFSRLSQRSLGTTVLSNTPMTARRLGRWPR